MSEEADGKKEPGPGANPGLAATDAAAATREDPAGSGSAPGPTPAISTSNETVADAPGGPTAPGGSPSSTQETVADAPAAPAPPAIAARPVETDPEGETVADEATGAAEPAAGGAAPRAPEEAGLPAEGLPGYEILAELGRGGMAVVYEARQESLDRLVALKVMAPELARSPGFVARFEREAKALAALNHPNIVAIHDRGQVGECLFFVMEYVAGYSMRDVLEEVGTLPQEWALSMMTQVGEALAYVHEAGTIHRDIKPENVLVTEGGTVKVSDFGLAGMAERTPDGNLTRDNAMMGTLNYMAPEQRLDAARVDHRADIYSFGVMLYEVLTGQLPMGKFDPATTLVPGLDPGLDKVIDACLQTDPARRPAAMAKVVQAMRAIESRSAPPPAPAEAPASDPAAATASSIPLSTPERPAPARHTDEELEAAMARLAKAAEEDRKRAEEDFQKNDEAARAKRREAEKDRDKDLDKTAAQTEEVIRWDKIFGFFGEWTEAVIFGLGIGIFLLLGGFESIFPKDVPESKLKKGAGGVTIISEKQKEARNLRDSVDKVALTTEELALKEQEELAAEPVEITTDPLESLYSQPLTTGTSLDLASLDLLRLQPDPEDKRAVIAALKSTNPLEVLAALQLEDAGELRYSVKMLDRVMEFHDDPAVQNRVVEMLAGRIEERDDPAATESLLEYVKKAEGAGAGYALALLREQEVEVKLPPEVSQRYLLRAALARPDDAAGLRAIRDLAALDSEDATEMLKRLRTDRSASISRVATMAWQFRVRMGLVEGKRAMARDEIHPPDLEFFEGLAPPDGTSPDGVSPPAPPPGRTPPGDPPTR